MASSGHADQNLDFPFLELAAELRNSIYELVCGLESDTDGQKINLIHAKPPTAGGLLLTCRQIYNEASSIYKHALRTYWSSTHFYLDQEELLSAGFMYKNARRSLKYSQHFALINHVVLCAEDSGYWSRHTRGRDGAWLEEWGRDEADYQREYLRMSKTTSGAWTHNSDPMDTNLGSDAQAGGLPGGLGVTVAEIMYLMENVV